MRSGFVITVQAQDAAREGKWQERLQQALLNQGELKIRAASESEELGQILFVDSEQPDLEKVLDSVDRRGRAVFLIVGENSPLPGAIEREKADDVLIFPFRPLEVLSKLRHYQRILMWDEVFRLNSSFSEILERLQEDLKLAERLQKNRIQKQFHEIRGFKVAHRYLAGMKSGGDHFDLAESRDGQQVSVVLSDSSSYGLSSAVLSVFMRVVMKLSSEEVRSCSETVKRIREELLLTLGDQDQLSLFYAVISKKNYQLRYVNLGNSSVFYAPPSAEFQELPKQGDAIRKAAATDLLEGSLSIEPEGRLAMISDGWVEGLGGKMGLLECLNQYRDQEAIDLMNEITYRIKSGFSEPDDLPAQDCTALVMDVDSRVIRLTRGEN